MTNNFNPKLPDEISLGAFRVMPFPVVGTASICIFNNEIQTVSVALSDVRFAIQDILNQCFDENTGTHGTFTITSNDGSSNSVILSINEPDFACIKVSPTCAWQSEFLTALVVLEKHGEA
jgi:hypothetical protein